MKRPFPRPAKIRIIQYGKPGVGKTSPLAWPPPVSCTPHPVRGWTIP